MNDKELSHIEQTYTILEVEGLIPLGTIRNRINQYRERFCRDPDEAKKYIAGVKKYLEKKYRQARILEVATACEARAQCLLEGYSQSAKESNNTEKMKIIKKIEQEVVRRIKLKNIYKSEK